MALNIKDERTDRLARELAQLTGESLTTAIKQALEDRLAVERRRHNRTPHDLSDIIRRGRARAVIDDRPEDEILG